MNAYYFDSDIMIFDTGQWFNSRISKIFNEEKGDNS